jgi:hypothetical protein
MTSDNIGDDSVPAQEARGADTTTSSTQNTDLLWTWLQDSDKSEIVNAAEAHLGEQRDYFLHQWLTIGNAVEILQNVIFERTNTKPKGRRYNQEWSSVAPANLRTLDKTVRSHALWLWEHRDEVKPWYESLACLIHDGDGNGAAEVA